MINQMKALIQGFNKDKINPYWVQHYKHTLGLVGAGTTDLLSQCAKNIDPDKCYLEVGIYQGVNFFGVATTAGKTTCYGVDNFSQEFSEKEIFKASAEEIVASRHAAVRANGYTNSNVIKADFREFLTKTKNMNGKPVELYLFDGPHELQDQIDGVEKAFHLLSDEAIVVIDDWNSPNVQQSSQILAQRHGRHLEVLKVFESPQGSRDTFNQGQIYFSFYRNPR